MENFEYNQMELFDFIKAPEVKDVSSLDLTQTKFNFEVKEITKEECLNLVQKYHYSNTLPKLNKHFLGFFLGGVC